MASSCRFAFAVHILTVLAYKEREGGTSDLLAGSVNTNAVVIRRILADLRRAGLVKTHRGALGGAKLSRRPCEITLDEVYRAVTQSPAFGLHRQHPNQKCPVGRKIELVLGTVFSSAQQALESALARQRLSDVLETVTQDDLSPSSEASPALSISTNQPN